MVIQYVASDWLFINQLIIRADDATFLIPESGELKMERDNGGRKIWEWITIPVEEAELKMLEKIASSEKVIPRAVGSQYKKDRDLSGTEIKNIKTVLTAFRILVEEK